MMTTQGSKVGGSRLNQQSCILAMACLAGSGTIVAIPAPPPKGHALVICNTDYSDSALPVDLATNASEIAIRLDDLRFSVTEKFNVDLEGFRSALSDLDHRWGFNLVYYCGRGVRAGGNIYLKPVDADLSLDQPDAFSSMLSLEELAMWMDAPINVVIIDSILDDLVQPAGETPEAQAWTGWLAKKQILFAFSQGIGDAKVSGPHTTNSQYAEALLQHLGTGLGEGLEEVLARMSADVRNATGGKWRPWHVSSLRKPLHLEMYPYPLALYHLRQAKLLFEARDYAGVWSAFENLRAIQAHVALASTDTRSILRRLEDTSRQILEEERDYGEYEEAREMVDAMRVENKNRESEARAAIRAMEFVQIPLGTFQRGSNSPLAEDNERPVATVTISKPYDLGKYEVTQGQWEAVMGKNPSHFVACGEDCPVESVSWSMANEFLWRVNELERDSSYKYRLPTEAEWEYAARAGTESDTYAGNLTEPHGADPIIEPIAWYSHNSDDRTHPVGRKEPNDFGLHDMLGNVSEWVQDRNGRYPGAATTNPVGPSQGSMVVEGYETRAVRGGSYHDEPRDCRSAERNHLARHWGTQVKGFRIVRTPR